MTGATDPVILPIETADEGSPILGTILAVVWGALGGLLIFACLADGLDKGFAKSWWLALLAAPFCWLFHRALRSAFGRAYYTVTAERGPRPHPPDLPLAGVDRTDQPVQRAVEVSSESHNVGQGSAGGSFTATLVHGSDHARDVELHTWSWTLHGETASDAQEIRRPRLRPPTDPQARPRQGNVMTGVPRAS